MVSSENYTKRVSEKQPFCLQLVKTKLEEKFKKMTELQQALDLEENETRYWVQMARTHGWFSDEIFPEL